MLSPIAFALVLFKLEVEVYHYLVTAFLLRLVQNALVDSQCPRVQAAAAVVAAAIHHVESCSGNLAIRYGLKERTVNKGAEREHWTAQHEERQRSMIGTALQRYSRSALRPYSALNWWTHQTEHISQSPTNSLRLGSAAAGLLQDYLDAMAE